MGTSVIPSMMFAIPVMSFIICNIPLGGSTWPTLIGQALKPGPVCGHDGVTYPHYIIALWYGAKIECWGKCPCKDACDEPAGIVGPCEAIIPRWTFIKETGKCKKFTYGGCRGNGNRFKSADECISTCGATARPCDQSPGIKGPCRGSFRRFTFHKENYGCSEFTYGGCGGNDNRFDSEWACYSTCMIPPPDK